MRAKTVGVFLGGYTFDEAGLRMWPLHRCAARWRDLTDFELRRVDGEYAHYSLLLSFSARRKPVTITIRGGTKNLRRMATVFRWIDSALSNLAICKRQLISDLFMLEGRVTDQFLVKPNPSDEERLDRAKFWWWALNARKSVKECAPVLAGRGPLEVEAALMTIDGLLASGKSDVAVDALEKILQRRRDNAELIARGAALLLDLDDARGEQLAEEAFSRNIARIDAVGLHWSAYNVRRKRWDCAMAILDRLERTAAAISPDLATELLVRRGEIAELTASPAVAFRRINVRSFLRHLLGWGLPLAFLALVAWPVYLVGPLFYQEAQTLRRLRDHGVRVESSHLQDLSRRDGRESMLAELRYVFAPDPTTAESWDLRLPSESSMASIDAFIAWERAGELPRGWYHGHSTLYDHTAKFIEQDPAQQFVTFLPDDPSTNAIGPITWTRIWCTWLAGGKAVVMAVGAVGLVAFLTVQYACSRLRRWSAGKHTL